jgi:hypothetical protein
MATSAHPWMPTPHYCTGARDADDVFLADQTQAGQARHLEQDLAHVQLMVLILMSG